MTNLVRIAAICLACGAAMMAPAQAKNTHAGRDIGAYSAIVPDTHVPASHWNDAYPYDDDAHQTATGGPSGGLPGRS